MLAFVYGLSAATALLCAALLLRGFSRGGGRLLLWSGLCFLGLALDNTAFFADRILFTDTTFTGLELARRLVSLSGLALLIYGMVWDVN